MGWSEPARQRNPAKNPEADTRVVANALKIASQQPLPAPPSFSSPRHQDPPRVTEQVPGQVRHPEPPQVRHPEPPQVRQSWGREQQSGFDNNPTPAGGKPVNS